MDSLDEATRGQAGSFVTTSMARAGTIATTIGDDGVGEIVYSSVIVGSVRPLRSDE